MESLLNNPVVISGLAALGAAIIFGALSLLRGFVAKTKTKFDDKLLKAVEDAVKNKK